MMISDRRNPGSCGFKMMWDDRNLYRFGYKCSFKTEIGLKLTKTQY